METGKSPLHWPVVMYDSNETELYSIVLMANLVYGLTTFYYQTLWKNGISMSKDEFYDEVRNCLDTDATCKAQFMRA